MGGGGEPYTKLSASVGAELPEGVVTVTSTRTGNAAKAWGDGLHFAPLDIGVTRAASVPPNSTANAPSRWFPLIVTVVPPDTTSYFLGVTESITGLSSLITGAA